jgi:hypothetical protein
VRQGVPIKQRSVWLIDGWNEAALMLLRTRRGRTQRQSGNGDVDNAHKPSPHA